MIEVIINGIHREIGCGIDNINGNQGILLTLYMLNFQREQKHIFTSLAFLHIDMTQVVKILPQVKQKRLYCT